MRDKVFFPSGILSRYVKSFFSVQRFNKSLQLVRSADLSLTNIAYECGYYDQAHFIKEFKSYTGISPSRLA